MSAIDTDALSEKYRAASIQLGERKLLIADLRGTEQEQDLSTPPNCGGFGRVRHFRRGQTEAWPENPLPIDPAAAALKRGRGEELCAQVFQNAACNWRCW